MDQLLPSSGGASPSLPPYALVVMGLKLLRVLLSWVSVFLATRIFSPIYEDLVYEQRKDPPNLGRYVGIYVGLELAFNAFVIALLALAAHIFGSKPGSAVDARALKAHAIDYGASLAVTASLGSWLASVVALKRYFKYKFEGLRAIRAFERMLLAVAVHAHLTPFFAIFSSIL